METARRGVSWILCVALAVAVGACGIVGLDGEDGPEGISFEVREPVYQRGDTIYVWLRNGTGHALGYNLCVAQLKRRVGGGWASVQRRESPYCILPLWVLDPGEETAERQIVHPFIEAGTYRFEASVEWPVNAGGPVSLLSNTFVIEGS